MGFLVVEGYLTALFREPIIYEKCLGGECLEGKSLKMVYHVASQRVAGGVGGERCIAPFTISMARALHGAARSRTFRARNLVVVRGIGGSRVEGQKYDRGRQLETSH